MPIQFMDEPGKFNLRKSHTNPLLPKMTEEVNPSRSIGDELNLFIRHVESLQETLPLAMSYIQYVWQRNIE